MLCVCHYRSHPAQHLAFIFYYIYYIYTYIIHIISYQYITYIFISSRIYFIKYFIISKELYYIHGGYTPGWRGVGAAVVRPTTWSHILKNHITLSSFWCKKLDIRGGYSFGWIYPRGKAPTFSFIYRCSCKNFPP